jgi:hypothetical protein
MTVGVFLNGFVKVDINFGTLLVGAEGTKTPAGGRHGESEVPGAQINRPI